MSDSEALQDQDQEETRLAPVHLSPIFRSQPRVEWSDSTGAHAQVVDGKVLVGSAPASGLVVLDARPAPILRLGPQ